MAMKALKPALAWPIGAAALLFLALSLAASCGPKPGGGRQDAQAAAKDGPNASTGANPSLADLRLDDEALSWLRARAASAAPLRVALYLSPDTYDPAAPDGPAGFDYLLAKGLAECAGLRLEAVPHDNVQAFFAKDGSMPPDLGSAGSGYEYVPDLLAAVDLYALPLAVLPWRERLMAMVPVFPTRSQLAGRAGQEAPGVRALDGKTFAVIRDSYQHKTLAELAAKEGIAFSFVFARDESGLFALVREGRADYLLDGSVYFAKMAGGMQGLTLSPFPGDIVSTGWGVKKTDRGLLRLVEAYIEASQSSGYFGELWAKTYGMDFKAYIGALLATTESP